MIPRTRRVLAIAAVAGCAACGAVLGPDQSSAPLALFDQVWNDFDLHYSLFVVKHINWDSLRAVYRPLAQQAKNENTAQSIVVQMISNLHDGHVEFRGGPAGTPLFGNVVAATVTYGKYVNFEASLPGGVSYGIIPPGVGYIQISTFEGTDIVREVDAALAALKGVRALLIDVRNNDGGLLDNATGAASRFARSRTVAAYVRYRDGPAHTDFTRYIEQQVLPAGPFQFTGDVYLLTSRNTVSAAELFVMCMHALGNTTVVGDTTAGETGSPFARELQNGWTYRFPESIEYTLAGNAFEDIGLAPDVAVKNTSQQIQGLIDAQMQRAITLASQPK
jgi:carboxyl-terminal processing protease